jgi:rfaE bifunctional protein nucleotidyltransferase chain/domain
LGQVVSPRELILRRGEWKRTGEGVVCACGAFDLLHPGHIRLLEQARDFGNILVVTVQSDAMVRAGAARSGASGGIHSESATDRPFTPAAERAEILAALGAVDFTAVIAEALAEFLKQLRPDVFVCGDDAAGRPGLDGSDSLERALASIGCRIVRLPVEPGYSTSRLIERIAGNRA